MGKPQLLGTLSAMAMPEARRMVENVKCVHVEESALKVRALLKTRTTTRSCRDPETAVSNFCCSCRLPLLLLVCIGKAVVSN